MAEERANQRSTIDVFIRSRPLRTTSSSIEDKNEGVIHRRFLSHAVKKDFEVRKFKFSHVFKDHDCQDTVFERTAVPIVESVMSGYNGCIMAYGQTGTGKTHTILGKRDGLLPQSLNYIFQKSSESSDNFVIDISCLQIYMENLTDLFDYQKKAIQIREKNGTFFVTNAVWVRLNNYDEALQVLEETEMRRKSCSTNMNQFSSRSHAIFIIKVTNIRNMTSSNLYLVDLAGSERIKKSYAQGDRLEEAISINTSLMALSKCIYGISENKWNHIPYRESKLTKILQDTLAGNGRSVIIITISPDSCDVDETISSLKFGQRASKIYCSPKLCKIDDDELGNNVYALDGHKKLLEEENFALREQCKQLLKIVETTTSKKQNLAEGEDAEDDDEVENHLEVRPSRYTTPIKSLLEDMGSGPFPEDYQRLREENAQLKQRIDKAELDAFDNMRIAYEEIEEKLYSEISDLKALSKKQKKTMVSQNRSIADLMTQLEAAKEEISILKGNNRVCQNSNLKLKENITAQKENYYIQHGSNSKGTPNNKTLIDQITSIFKQNTITDPSSSDQLKNQVIYLIENNTNFELLCSQADKENRLVRSGIKESCSKNQTPSKRPAQREFGVDFDLKQTTSHFLNTISPCKHIEQSTDKVDAENQYRSASVEDKNTAQSMILKALESLVNEVETKCCTAAANSMNEEEALNQVSQRMGKLISGFASSATFTKLLDDFSANRFSIMKLAIGTIVDSLVKKLVVLGFAFKQKDLLNKQNTFLKSIVFDEKVNEQCINVIRTRNMSRRAAVVIQRAFKRYRWRKSYLKQQASVDAFDMGRMKAAMGKENLQILLTEIENTMASIHKALC